MPGCPISFSGCPMFRAFKSKFTLKARRSRSSSSPSHAAPQLESAVTEPSTSTPTPTFTPQLPPELWVIIFRHAITSPPNSPRVPWHSPFRYLPHKSREHFQVRCSLVRVCKLWRALALPFLYGDAWVPRSSGIPSFFRVLASSATADPQAGYGRWVRQLVLPISGIHGSLSILDFCPNIEELSVPFDLRHHIWGGPFPFRPSDHLSLSFTSLHRLLWSFDHYSEPEDVAYRVLIEILLHAPNLSHLSLIHYRRPQIEFLPQDRVNRPLASLESLEFFSLFTTATPFVPQEVDLPNLIHVIAPSMALNYSDPTIGYHSSFLSVYGKQLEIVMLLDFGPPTETTTSDFLAVLQHCPNLEILSYFVNHTFLPQANAVLHKSLGVIVLRIHGDIQDADAFRRCLRLHFSAFTTKAFPVLRQIVLKGDWSWTLRRPQFRQLYAMLLDRGLRISVDDDNDDDNDDDDDDNE